MSAPPPLGQVEAVTDAVVDEWAAAGILEPAPATISEATAQAIEAEIQRRLALIAGQQ